MESPNPLLPLLNSSRKGIIRRAENITNALQTIQQEANADYWFEKGLRFQQVQAWGQASLCFDRVLDIDNTHWRGWLLSGHANGRLCRVEKCREAFIGSEKYGKPKKEADFFSFLLPGDLEYLLLFLNQNMNEGDLYQATVSLALIHFHKREYEFARLLLEPLVGERSEKTAWVQYYLTRIDFEEGNYKSSINRLRSLAYNELRGNARVQFWVAQAYMHEGRERLESFNVWKSTQVYKGGHDSYPDFHYLFGDAVRTIKLAIALEPQNAEYQFCLGEIEQSYPSRGAGFDAFHKAVTLDPGNAEYILARVNSTWSGAWEVDSSEASSIIAFAEAADAFPDNLEFVQQAGAAFYQVESYHAALEMFAKAALLSPPAEEEKWQRDSRMWRSKECDEMQNDCVAKIGAHCVPESLSMRAAEERAHWQKLSANT
ncbi:hypothetical protein FY528_19435 [Hymenobacter lutimineralis]|uniref:Uncharacterized protein n=1 Tax=Hymenobacter lutimineralis TaxID=2606448 RepID=A0A5D6UR01_9BACT|nr:hypothetical protein [Hymenobacter lutimineralis]TYZ06101.1 hypothetical protein FY528_19435 [Hymenobacter lutimineralis]